MKDVFEFLKMNVKGSKYYLLGFSMGGNIVTKFIGEIGDKADYYNIHGGVSICGPLNLKSFTDMTENQSKFKIYSKVFCKNLKSVFYIVSIIASILVSVKYIYEIISLRKNAKKDI